MKMKGILATTHLDAHGTRLAKEALEDMAAQINSNSVPGVGSEHDILIPPQGKVISARVVRMNDGEYALEGEQEIISPSRLSRVILPTGDIGYIDRYDDRRPFKDKYEETPEQTEISVDMVNFDSEKSAQEFITTIEQIENQKAALLIRKSLIPDPEIIFKLSQEAIKWFLVTKAAKSLGNRISDDIAEDLHKLYKNIRDTAINYAALCLPKNRPITHVVIISGKPAVECVIRTTDPIVFGEAVETNKLIEVINSTDEYHKKFKAQKIQFVYSEDKKAWAFNYLLTTEGSVVGSEIATKKRNKVIQINRIKLKG